MRMKKLAVFLVCGLVAGSAWATLYNDSVGDLSVGPGILDIVSVEVMNDATDIMLTITLADDPVATDWGKYMVAIDSVPGGDVAGNGWGRPISMSSGMDYWVGSWVDSGSGAETYSWDGAAWNLDNATYNPTSDIQVPVVSGAPDNTVILTTTLASLGLSVGDTFVFDVFSSGGGGGDSAIDALSDPNPSVADWGDAYDSTSQLSYEVIPEPGTLALLGLGVLAMAVRRRH
jgi:hypothetical protein